MSDYKNYLLRAMGVTESKKTVDPEVEKAAKKEKGEHPQLSKKDAELIAKQHLGKGKVKEGLLSTMVKSPLMSPTAIATPVIGVAVRGSATGGLPSGADQIGDISPSRLGGYQKVNVDPVNSKLVNKTPSNPDINQNTTPIVDDPALQGGVTHTHQVQKNAGETPQAVTGASSDTDSTLKLKSAMPKGIDIDIAQEGCCEEESEPANMGSHVKKEHPNLNETFARHKELMKEKLKIKESSCKCCGPDCTCGCNDSTTDECKSCGCGKPNTSHDMKENVGAKEPFVTNWKMDPEKAGLVRVSEAFDRLNSLAGLKPLKEEEEKQDEKPDVVKGKYIATKKKYFDPKTKTVKDVDWISKAEVKETYSAPFERMRGLANLGERKLGKDGLWAVNEVNYTTDANGNPTIAVGAPGSDVRNAIEKGTNCKSCGKRFVPSYGEYHRCPDCLASQLSAAEKATGVQETLRENATPTEKLKGIKEALDRKSKKGTLNDKEMKLFRKLEEALKKRSSLDKQSQAVDKNIGKMQNDPNYRPAPFDKDHTGPMRHGNDKGQLPAK